MKANLRRYLISVAVGLVIVGIVLATRDIFSETDANQILVTLNDAFFISGMCLTCVGGLVFVSNNGIFYMFGYGLSMLFGKRKRNVRERKYKDFYEYKKAKDEEKRSCAYLLLVGLAFVAVAAILLIWIDW